MRSFRLIVLVVGAACLAGNVVAVAEDAPAESVKPYARSVTEFGAVGDGVTNDTAAVNRAFASGCKHIVLPPGRYLAGPEPLTVPEGVTLEGAGSGSVLAAAPETGVLLALGKGCRLAGFRIDGTHIARGDVGDGVIALGDDADGVFIERLLFETCDRVCILTDHADDLTVRDCTFRQVGLAVNVVFSDRARILNNTVEDARLHGIQFWGNWQFERKECRDLLIAGNRVKNGGAGAIWGTGGVRVVAANNSVDGAEDVGIDLEWCDDSTITGNTVRNCKNAGISLFFASRNVAVSGNTIVNDHAIEDAGADWWVRAGIWLTGPNRGKFPGDHGHRNVAITGNVIQCAEGERRSIWIGPESENIVIEANAIHGGELRRDDETK